LIDRADRESKLTGAIITARNGWLQMGATLSSQLEGLNADERAKLIDDSVETIIAGLEFSTKV
jgi:hypothetical protein